ncbi:MAG: 1-deoxy-D-xylulose-5-phosphate synthase [Myxococcaceae bacterium]|nr:1-deoxy-D-xylulose-5-phosphate synthase [Myxococcaceae bacterium]
MTLQGLDSPAAVRALGDDELPALCAALREEIISVCSRVGGHLGASLGAVELIVALHRVFRSPIDRLVFDVGHQAYAHKLLTGRREQLGTLRQAGGLAPFLDPTESEHDAFGAGHSSTAISAAVGLLEGLVVTGAPGRVVAVIGDGALTGGEAFEGLNQAAVASRPLIVVVNDNGMSISRNVGAVARLLRSDARRFFEAMGFCYVGPVDGHDVGALVAVLRQAKDCARAVVIHARTEKGRGFAPAEADGRTRGHAMGPWELRDGKLVRARPGRATWSDAFAALLEERLARDPSLVVVTPAMIEGSSLGGLQARFPARVFDVGIAEQHAVTFAAGLAKSGARPIVCLYSTFLQRAYDQIVHDVVLPGLPVVFAVDRAGLVGADGATHQGVFDVSLLRPLPGLSLTSPVFLDDLGTLLDAALARRGPSAVRFPRGVVTGPRPPSIVPAPATRWLRRVEGGELTCVTSGVTGLQALEACEGRPWSVLDVGELCELDEGPLREAARGRLLVIEEVMPRGGLFDAVLEGLARVGCAPLVAQVALPAHRIVRHGEANAQRRELGLSSDGIERAARELLERRP